MLDRRALFGHGAGSLIALAGAVSASRAVHAADVGSAPLWSPFADGVAALGDVLGLAGVPLDPVDQAEGARLLSRYLAVGLDFCLEYADPAFPALFQGTRDGVRKYAGDNPDEIYCHATVSPEFTYRLHGNMRGSLMCEVGVYSGDAFLDPKAHPVRLLDFITEDDIAVGPDGSFEVVVGHASRVKGARNVLSLPAGASSLLMRRYRSDPFGEVGAVRIERIGAPAIPPPLDPAVVARKLAIAAQWARSNATIWANYVSERSRTKRNVLVGFDDNGQLGAPGGHQYLEGYWAVPADKALVLDFIPPAARYWQLVICNYWMESLEWRFGAGVNYNNRTAARRGDGSVRFIVSRNRPRQADANWLATQDHAGGMLCLRAARMSGAMPHVTATVVDSSTV